MRIVADNGDQARCFYDPCAIRKRRAFSFDSPKLRLLSLPLNKQTRYSRMTASYIRLAPRTAYFTAMGAWARIASDRRPPLMSEIEDVSTGSPSSFNS
jgi:hypothetical protein